MLSQKVCCNPINKKTVLRVIRSENVIPPPTGNKPKSQGIMGRKWMKNKLKSGVMFIFIHCILADMGKSTDVYVMKKRHL